ncbi:MAG: ABC transporter ATP-binding protein [Patescibacteria group bacterium]|nr:ABC transporter ATP-binding protein [Patescibacteria group bacterium]
MASHSIILKAENLTKKYRLAKQKTFKEFLPAFIFRKKTSDELIALDNLNFELTKGESLGILGRNGSGKSTLLKIIASVSQPSAGKLHIQGKIAPLIELGAGFHPELTGRENIYLNGALLGYKKKDLNRLLPDIVSFAELNHFIDQPVKHYSSGMYLRLAFSIATAKRPDILLVDEILAVGDLQFQRKCLERIRKFQQQKTNLILVTHDLNLAKSFCQKVLVLDQGKQIFFGEAVRGVKKYLDITQ